MKILLADDSQFMRTILKGILDKLNLSAEYIEAGGGIQTVELYLQHHPDLLLLDLIMPEKDGMDVLREISSQKGTGKIIIVSAIGQDKVMEEAKALGADGFIVKPFDEKKVADAIRTTVTP